MQPSILERQFEGDIELSLLRHVHDPGHLHRLRSEKHLRVSRGSSEQRARRVGPDLFGRLVEVGSEDDAGARVLEKILGLLHVGAEQANHQRN